MNKSFTLIEILVVIVVIGILSAFILVGMSSITSSANIAKSQAFENSIRNSLLTNLVSEWKFNGNANDSWGINNGTVSSATLTSNGCVRDSCYSFDGTDDIISFGNDASLSMRTGDHTVSIWVKFNTPLSSIDYETVIYCGASGAAGDKGYWIRRELGTNRIWGGLNDGSTTRVGGYLSASGSAVANTWYHLVVLFDRDDSAKAYFNAVQAGSFVISTRPGDIQNTDSLKMGAYISTMHRLNGYIDEAKIYHSIISSQLINQEYYSGINNLLVNNEIDDDNFMQRLADLRNNLATHE